MANIVICSDGTWNRPEEDLEKDFPTNVLKLARAITPLHDETKQHVFYDWGLGSYHNSAIAGATGQGIHKNILDGYRYIVQNYNPDDKIFLFGFSRGAYTVRALSGLINNCGILKREEANRIIEAWDIYKNPSDKYHPSAKSSVTFRNKYCHPSRNVHFIGVWDTVGALGIPVTFLGLLESHDEFYDTKMGSNISYARHALSIDEKRQDFAPTIWEPKEGVNLKQVWFAGVHTDIGGSYPPDEKTGVRSSDIPLEWMLKEAVAADLIVDPYLFSTLTSDQLGKTHRSRKHVFRMKKPLDRELIVEGKPTKIHPSVKKRYEEDEKYRPPQLKKIVESDGWDSLDIGE